MDTKESVLRILETAKAKCGQAVLDGTMTVREYEEATGLDGTGLKEQIVKDVRAQFKEVCGVIREQARESAQRACDRLLAAGMDVDIITDVLGAVTIQEGRVTALDWGTITKEPGA